MPAFKRKVINSFLLFNPQLAVDSCVLGIAEKHCSTKISFCRPKIHGLVLVLFKSMQRDRQKSAIIFVRVFLITNSVAKR